MRTLQIKITKKDNPLSAQPLTEARRADIFVEKQLPIKYQAPLGAAYSAASKLQLTKHRYETNCFALRFLLSPPHGASRLPSKEAMQAFAFSFRCSGLDRRKGISTKPDYVKHIHQGMVEHQLPQKNQQYVSLPL
jgi:hypothetical protein